MELKYQKLDSGDEKHPNYLVVVQGSLDSCALGDLVRTEAKTDLGPIPCWKFITNMGEDFQTRTLREAKFLIESRLMGLIANALETGKNQAVDPSSLG